MTRNLNLGHPNVHIPCLLVREWEKINDVTLQQGYCAYEAQELQKSCVNCTQPFYLGWQESVWDHTWFHQWVPDLIDLRCYPKEGKVLFFHHFQFKKANLLQHILFIPCTAGWNTLLPMFNIAPDSSYVRQVPCLLIIYTWNVFWVLLISFVSQCFMSSDPPVLL